MTNAATYLILAGLALVPVPDGYPETRSTSQYEHYDEDYEYDTEQYKIDAGYDGNFIFYCY